MLKKFYLILIILLALFVRIPLVDSSFWLDEAAQVIESLRPFRDQFLLEADFHPPLFHIILHFWLKLSSGEAWARCLSIILSVFTIIFTYKISRKLFGVKTGLIASLFLSINPFFLWYSQEVRPYMLFAFLSTVSWWFFLNTKKISYITAIVLMSLTNYFFIFIFAGQALFAFIQKGIKISLAVGAATGVAITYLFWSGMLFKQLTLGLSGEFTGWKEVVSADKVKYIPLTIAKFFVGKASIDNNLIYFLILLPALIALLYAVFSLAGYAKRRIIIFMLFAPLALSWLVNLVLPLSAPQRMIAVLPFFSILLAYPIKDMKFNLTGGVYSAVLFLTFSISIISYWNNPSFQRERWREAVAYVEKEGGSDALSIFIFPDPFAPFIYYSSGRLPSLGIAPKFNLTQDDAQLLNSKIAGQKRIFYFSYLTGITDREGMAKREFARLGYNEKTVKDFPGVGFVYLYEK